MTSRNAYWSCNPNIELNILREDARTCSAGGRDADPHVTELMLKPYMARQLAKLDPETVRAELAGYGAWDEYELADHGANLKRLVWCACCDVAEGQ